MLIILHGADTYRSRQRLKNIIDEYRSSMGQDVNFHHIDCEEDDISDLKSLCETQSLFLGKKLVVAEYFFHNPEQFEKVLPVYGAASRANDLLLVLWERGLDKNQKKKIEKISVSAKIQEFEELAGAAKIKFIAEEAQRRHIPLDSSRQAVLAGESDSWGVINALEKMTNEHDVETGIRGSESLTIYALGDVFFSSQKNAVRVLMNLLRQGEDEFGVFSYAASHTHTLLLIKAFAEIREPVPPLFGIHPYVIKKTAGLVRELSAAELAEAHAAFFEKDAQIKTGVLRPAEALMAMLLDKTVKTKTA